MSNEKNQSERIFVKRFNKYLDELSVDEWNEITNLNCTLDNDPDTGC